MKISLAADHAGLEYKELIKKYLTSKGHEVIDRGTNSKDSVDYPDFVKKAAKDVAENFCDLGIGVCNSGIGVSIAANKVKGIRAALVFNVEMASLARKHNNANFLAITQKFTPQSELYKIIDAFFSGQFEGGRHQRRVDKLEQF